MSQPHYPQLKHSFPTFLFFSLCGFYFIVLQMGLSHAPDRFLEVHKASAVPLSLSNGRLPLLDKILIPLISFFVAAFYDPTSSAYPTVVDFVWSFGAAIQLPLIEAARREPYVIDQETRLERVSRKLIAHPMIWGILYQRLSGGWILPLWLLAFMYSRTRADGAGIDQVQAESVLAGWWIGHTLPALVMLIPGQPPFKRTPIWVAFPILMSVAQQGYLVVRKWLKPVDREKSGYATLQLLYLSAFALSFAAHIHLVLIPGLASAPSSYPTPWVLLNKLLGLSKYLYNFFAPAAGLRIPRPEETTAASGVVHFVQFDVLIVFAAVWTAGVLDLALRRSSTKKTECEGPRKTTARWVTRTVVLLIASALVIGPGAATAGFFAYREAKLEHARRTTAATEGIEEEAVIVSDGKDAGGL